jgi:anti-sigma factor RsiW
MMTHAYVEEENVVGRYVLGTLPADDLARFEEHLLECAECQTEVETSEGLRGALLSLAAQGAARTARPKPAAWRPWRRPSWRASRP